MFNPLQKTNYKDYNMRYAKDFNQRKNAWQKFSWILLKMIIFFFYKFNLHNKENIPKGRYIVAANHTCYFDPFMVSMIIKRPIAYMAKKELFEKNYIGSFLLDELAAFAVNREHLEISTIKTVKEIFKTSDWSMGIFPEGGIRRNKQFSKINKGFAVIAQMVKTDILPIGITGLESYNWNPFRKKEINVTIGTVIPYTKSVDEIIDDWVHQVAKMNNYAIVDETENNKSDSNVTVEV